MVSARSSAPSSLRAFRPRQPAAILSRGRGSSHAALEREFCTLFLGLRPKAYNAALRILQDPEDAEDVVQEAFISAYRAYPRFRGQSQPSTWLHRIVVNACLMRLRLAKSRPVCLKLSLDAISAVGGGVSDPEREAINSELRAALRQDLGLLPRDLREAVVLRDIEGLSTAEAARLTGVSAGAFKMRLHRGRGMLRRSLRAHLGTPCDPVVRNGAYRALV